MYNNFIKLTEQHTRDSTRPCYVNINHVTRLVRIENRVTRLYCSEGGMIDVLEKPEEILAITDTLVITDKDNTDGGSRNEDGRISNSTVKPDR